MDEFINQLGPTAILLGYKLRGEVEPSWILVTRENYPDGNAIGVSIDWTSYNDIHRSEVESPDLEAFMEYMSEQKGYTFKVMDNTKVLGTFMLEVIDQWEAEYPVQAAELKARGEAEEARLKSSAEH